MRTNGVKIIRTRKYKATTDSNHAFNIAPNLLDQDFSTNGPNQKWAGDISYIRSVMAVYIWRSPIVLGPTAEMVSLFDLYCRCVIGHLSVMLCITCRSMGAVSNRIKRDMAIRALDMAVAFRQPAKGCNHHTHRGSQYCSGDYQKAQYSNTSTGCIFNGGAICWHYSELGGKSPLAFERKAAQKG